jgi:uncharacterized protein
MPMMRISAKRLCATLTGLLLLVVGIGTDAIAGPFEDALAAAQSGDYSTANWALRPLADHGNAVAQFDLGSMYESGHGVPQDYIAAMKWFRLAAEQGNAMAQYDLGSMYYNGHGVAQDYTEAAKWFQRAAEQDYAWAQFYFGFFLANGFGVPKDLIQAHLWLNLATISHFDPPFGSLRIMDEKERRALGNLATGARDKVEKEMTKDQIAEAQMLAGQWKPKLQR